MINSSVASVLVCAKLGVHGGTGYNNVISLANSRLALRAEHGSDAPAA
jgi:hypothetical protein